MGTPAKISQLCIPGESELSRRQTVGGGSGEWFTAGAPARTRVQGVKEESSLCDREADQRSHGAKQWRGW